MKIKYRYVSSCCSNLYYEIRSSEDVQVLPKCYACGQGEYELQSETVLEESNPTVLE
jgi:hypothetical protein